MINTIENWINEHIKFTHVLIIAVIFGVIMNDPRWFMAVIAVFSSFILYRKFFCDYGQAENPFISFVDGRVQRFPSIPYNTELPKHLNKISRMLIKNHCGLCFVRSLESQTQNVVMVSVEGEKQTNNGIINKKFKIEEARGEHVIEIFHDAPGPFKLRVNTTQVIDGTQRSYINKIELESTQRNH